MNNYCVYFHKNPITKEVFYIGKGIGNRPYVNGGRGKYYNNYVKKYGKPIVSVLETNLSNEEAIELEKFYIKYFGRKNLNNGILVNCTDGGEGCEGLIHSKETKKHLSECRSGKPSNNKGKKWKQKVSKLGIKRGKYKQRKDKGRTYDSETKIRMGNGHKKPILQFNKNNIFIKEWRSTTDAENELKINGIRNVLSGDAKTCGNFIWKYKI